MSMDQGPTTPLSRPRPRSRGLSFGSIKSGGSEGKPKFTESPQDKARRDSFWKGLSKANPNAAVNEAQPSVANVTEETTLGDLRQVRHKDIYGNDIADPDLSNPTRPRMERPLDTIRSFEKAIDDGYKRRSSYLKQEPERWDQNNQYASRRSSYFGGEYTPSKKRQSTANNRPTGYDGPSPNHHHQGGYYGNQNGHHGNRGPPSRMRYSERNSSDPQLYGNGKQRTHHPQHGYQSSYDTVNTSGSDGTGPWASGTDPSSENSSIDRVKPQTPINGYDNYSNGYNGPIMEEQGPSGYQNYPQQNGFAQRDGYGQQPNGYGPQDGYAGQPEFRSPRQIYNKQNMASTPSYPPPPPSGPRRPMQLNSGPQPVPTSLPSTKREPEKRKSWLARRFSKKD